MSHPDDPSPQPWAPAPLAAPRGADAWFVPHVLLVVVCVPFLWHAFWTQVYFEPTDDAMTEAYIHNPEVCGALVAMGAAIVGAVMQRMLKVGLRQRVAVLVGTCAVVGTALGIGALVAHARAPSAARITESVYTVPAPADATPLALDAVDSGSSFGYPRVSRKWQVGDPFLRSDSATADAALAHACDGLRAIATPAQGWKLSGSNGVFCSFSRTTHHVALRYSASLTPGDLAPNQTETVTVYLTGTIYYPG